MSRRRNDYFAMAIVAALLGLVCAGINFWARLG